MLHLCLFSIATSIVTALLNFLLSSLLHYVVHVIPVRLQTLIPLLSNSLMQELTVTLSPSFIIRVNSGTVSLCLYFPLPMTSNLLNAMCPGTSAELYTEIGFGFVLCFIFYCCLTLFIVFVLFFPLIFCFVFGTLSFFSWEGAPTRLYSLWLPL